MSLATDIADVFNHVYQSHRDSEPNNVVLADAAQRMAWIFENAGHGTADQFLDIASMSGLPCVRVEVSALTRGVDDAPDGEWDFGS